MTRENSKEFGFQKAFSLGFISIFAYLASYYLRNLLSVAAPEMQASGTYTAEFIGTLSSVYFLVYAMGQLVNGLIGDSINPKYMISIGLAVTATVVTAFPLLPFWQLQVACFALMGVGLSMLRGPIMKLISENLSKNYSRVICTFLSAVSFVGPLVARALAILFEWKLMFIVSGIFTYAIALGTFVFLSIFERKGMFIFHSGKKEGLSGYLKLFKIENFVFYMVIGGLVEIAGSAVTFWIPTYLSRALLLNDITTNALYSVISVITCLAPFFTLFVFKLIKERDIVLLRCGFFLSVIAFVVMILATDVYCKIVSLAIAKFCLGCCSSVLWSIYIPGMGKTGRVSSINGVINCTGYLSASIASKAFSKLVNLSWTGVLLIWLSIAAFGLIASLLTRSKKS